MIEIESCLTVEHKEVYEVMETVCIIGKDIQKLIINNINSISIDVYDSDLEIISYSNVVINIRLFNTTVSNVSDSVLFVSEYGFDYSSKSVTSESRLCHAFVNRECLICDSILDKGICTTPSPIGCFIYKDRCLQCLQNYYLKNGNCYKCTSNCRYCTEHECLLCANGYHGPDCLTTDNAIQDKILMCTDGYFANDTCNQDYTCSLGTQQGCIICNGSRLVNSTCIHDNSVRMSMDDSLECNDGFFQLNSTCIPCSIYGDCKTCAPNTCLECIDSFPGEHGICTKYEIPEKEKRVFESCELTNNYTCVRCMTGYYWNGTNCNKCSDNCLICRNQNECISCNNSFYLNDSICIPRNEDLINRCKDFIIGKDNMCAVCRDGYYMYNGMCNKCSSGCSKCTSMMCVDCTEYHFLHDGACYSYDTLNNCTTLSNTGCKKCSDGYYLNNGLCYKCTDQCNSCDGLTCDSCEKDYIIINNSCEYYTVIPNCKGASHGECTKCTFLHSGSKCLFEIHWWLWLLLGIVMMILVIIVILLISALIHRISRNDNGITLFNSKYSNIRFQKNDVIMYNTQEMDFGIDLLVDKETTTKICIGNNTHGNIKLQFSSVDNYKYDLFIEPAVISLKKNVVCEFALKLVPLCSCSVNDTLKLIVLERNARHTYDLPIKFSTVLTTKLDMDEITLQEKLGEGSFGVVYRGLFRRNQVAVKKSKMTFKNSDFINEISMLDKFRCDYIVYYFGYVNVLKNCMIVTEFAPYGNMNTIIGKNLDESVKIKMILDCAKGIQYLHINGILHRDIKPDNILLFDVNNTDSTVVNAKLTDFGTCRNINLLMTNMSFTRGIGTPKYMAPELLDRQHYKKPADIYSFSITMYELFSDAFAYDRSRFRYEWNIASFVQSGKRLELDIIKNEKIKELIQNTWKSNPLERLTIDEIIEFLL